MVLKLNEFVFITKPTPTIVMSKAWKFKYGMSNAFSNIILAQVMRSYKIRERSEDGTRAKKTFLERMATYGGTRVRKQLMPKLGKKIVAEIDENGKKRKRRTLVFDPNVHVKKEPQNNGNQMIVDVSTAQDNEQVSSITLPINEAEIESRTESRTKKLMRKVFTNKFNEGKHAMTLEEILDVIGGYNDRNKSREMDMSVVESDTVMVSGVLEMELQQEADISDVTLPPLPLGNIVNTTETFPNNEIDDEIENEVKLKCEEGCELEYRLIDSHEHVLDDRFGTGMSCVGCGKSLYQCMSKGKTPGAHMCKGCDVKLCTEMFCNNCYYKDNDIIASSRTRNRRRAAVLET